MYSDKNQITSRRRALSSVCLYYKYPEPYNIKKTYSTSSLTTSLFNADELEWDKDQDFSTFWESDSISSYDINERMAELITQNFLEFDFNSKEASTCSVNSRMSLQSPFLFSPKNTLNFVDLFNSKIFHDKMYTLLPRYEQSVINDLSIDKKYEQRKEAISKRYLHRSMPVLSQHVSIKLVNKSKHLSYLNLSTCSDLSIEMRNSKKNKKRDDLRLNLQTNYDLKPTRVSMLARKVSTSGSSVNFSRLGRLTKLKYYMNDISERFKGMIMNTFNSSTTHGISKNSLGSSNSNQLYSICEDTVDTYDIIEVDDILETPGVFQRECNSLIKTCSYNENGLTMNDINQTCSKFK